MDTSNLVVLLRGVVGSTAYGLATPESDRDQLAVFAAPTREILGLSGPKVAQVTHTSHDPYDIQVHEVGKFLAQAANCNPTIMDLLWLKEYETLTPDGQLLIDLRTKVLSTQRVRDAFSGYALQQAKALNKRVEAGKTGFASDLAKKTQKHGRHCFRLIVAGKHLLTYGELLVDVSAHRDELFAMGELAERAPAEFLEAFESSVTELDSIQSVLPDKPDMDAVNRTLVQIRLNHLDR